MDALTRDALLARRVEIETALQAARDEFQRLAGAIQLIDALVMELDARQGEQEGVQNA